MSHDVEFGLPWPLRVNPALEVAKQRHLAWMDHHGFLNDQPVQDYLDWRLIEVAAYFYPDADEDGLVLAADLMGWYFAPFDDLLDGPLGRQPSAVADLCQGLIDVLGGGRPVKRPEIEAFADIWRRWQQDMSTVWRARASVNWCEYLAVQITEAQLRTGQLSSGDDADHLWRRRRAVSAWPINDLAERISGCEVPALAWHSQTLVEMRDIAADVVSLTNDVFSAEKEARIGDRGNNLVLMREDQGLTFAQAIAEIQQRINLLVQRFVTLEQHAGRLGEAFPEADRAAILYHIEALKNWMRGNEDWSRASRRYGRTSFIPSH